MTATAAIVGAPNWTESSPNHKLWVGKYQNYLGINKMLATLGAFDDHRRANFSYAHLEHAEQAQAHLAQADLSNSDLRETDLSDVDLMGAQLWYADFEPKALPPVNSIARAEGLQTL